MSELHRSIGEVLALLRDEFPDVTISKIRFLESQGLVDPERTPSGYRRFYDKDIERLRWILRQQREHYLPLKVIKGRLDDVDPSVEHADPVVPAPVEALPVGPFVPPDAPTLQLLVEPHADAAVVAPIVAPPVVARRVLPEPSLFATRARTPGARRADDIRPEVPARQPAEEVDPDAMTASEMAAATGLRVADIAELERFGLIVHRKAGNVALYDGDALIVARLAAAFRAHGLEPRHLRMFKVTADREAALFEQLVLQLARQRTVEARRELRDTLTDLSRLTDSLHSVLLAEALRSLG